MVSIYVWVETYVHPYVPISYTSPFFCVFIFCRWLTNNNNNNNKNQSKTAIFGSARLFMSFPQLRLCSLFGLSCHSPFSFFFWYFWEFCSSFSSYLYTFVSVVFCFHFNCLSPYLFFPSWYCSGILSSVLVSVSSPSSHLHEREKCQARRLLSLVSPYPLYSVLYQSCYIFSFFLCTFNLCLVYLILFFICVFSEFLLSFPFITKQVFYSIIKRWSV